MWNIHLHRYAPELLQIIQIDGLGNSEPGGMGDNEEYTDVPSTDDFIPLDTWKNIGSFFEQVVSKIQF